MLNEYSASTNIPTDVVGKKLYESNSKTMYAILGGLSGLEFVKFIHCESAKELWDKLKNVYEGDTKVKNARL